MINFQAGMKQLQQSLKEKILQRPLLTFVRGASRSGEIEFARLPTVNKIGRELPVPDSFDGRIVWKGLLTEVRNQGECGSCWAFASTSTLASRFNIQSVGLMHVDLSPTKLLLCDLQGKEFDVTHPEEQVDANTRLEASALTKSGCVGNSLVDAWRYLYTIGTTTEKCFPYSQPGGFGLKNISKFEKQGQLPLCTSLSGAVGDMCADVSFHTTTGDEYGTPARFYRCFHYYSIAGTKEYGGNEYFIRHNIFVWGPVSTGMVVYPDFYTFDAKKEIYEWNGKGNPVGGHAIELVGWGENNSKKYWIVKNSWGKKWGREGYFYMARGNNNCKIEENIVTGIPDFFFPIDYKLINPGNFEWGESSVISRQRKDIDTDLSMSAGGIDPATGYTRRVMATHPWVDFKRPVELNDFPDWTTFIAGITSSPKNRYKFQKRVYAKQSKKQQSNEQSNDTPYYLATGLILFILIVSISVLFRMLRL